MGLTCRGDGPVLRGLGGVRLGAIRGVCIGAYPMGYLWGVLQYYGDMACGGGLHAPYFERYGG